MTDNYTNQAYFSSIPIQFIVLSSHYCNYSNLRLCYFMSFVFLPFQDSLCGFYGVMHNLNMNVLLSNTKLYTAMEQIANEKNCIWPPGNEGAASHSSLPSKTTKRELLASTTKSSKSTAASKIQQRQTIGRWKPHPCTDLERNDLLNRVKLAGHYRHRRTEEGNKCGTTYVTEESKWDVVQLDCKNNQYTSHNTAGIDRTLNFAYPGAGDDNLVGKKDATRIKNDRDGDHVSDENTESESDGFIGADSINDDSNDLVF